MALITRTPFIIAEISANHGGHINSACALIESAQWAGCDAVKIQLYEPEDMPNDGGDYEKYKTPREWLPQLYATADNLGIPLFSSVFAPWAVDFLEQFDPPAYKLASPESTRLNCYKELASKIRGSGKTFIASTGRRDATKILSLRPDYILYCVAGYPATVTDDDIDYIRGRANGFSDHSNDIKTPLAMIAAGASVIEKHFKLDDDCIDAAFSLNPQQMKLLCDIAHR